jgi:hypothetical protein
MDTNFSEMSNADIKLRLKTLEDIFDIKRKEIMKICDEMKELENEYVSGKNELELRKNIIV